MHEVLILAVKGLAGGTLVLCFALLSQGLCPDFRAFRARRPSFVPVPQG